MKHPNDKHYCPLLKREIYYGGWGGCIEIQEYREDSMDAELLPFEVDLKLANQVCEKCRWHRADVE